MGTLLPQAVLCGIVRNASSALSATLAAFQNIFSAMSDYRAVIVTNDNSDDTDAVLDHWGSLSHRHEVIAVDGLANAFPGRIDRIAAARNFYLQALARFDPGQFPLVIVADLDGPNATLTGSNLAKALTTAPTDWAGLFANQQRAYYDVFALRHEAWCPRDPWSEVRAATDSASFLGLNIKAVSRRIRSKATRKFIYDRQYSIPADRAPILVQSAFGGLGIYKRHALTGCWYSGREATGERVCEHVVLHRQMASIGARLFISPGLQNLAQEEHLGPTSGRPFPFG